MKRRSGSGPLARSVWHINFRALKDLSQREMVVGLPHIEHLEQLCEACLVGKQHRGPFPRISTYRAENPLELVHVDLCGPFSPVTLAGKKYFLLVVDDYSRMMWIVLIKSKDEALKAFKKIKARVEVELNIKMKALNTDRGGEFVSSEFQDFCAQQGLRRFKTAPHSPQQNGVAERRNQTIVGTSRSLLENKNVSGRFWGEGYIDGGVSLEPSANSKHRGEDSV